MTTPTNNIITKQLKRLDKGELNSIKRTLNILLLIMVSFIVLVIYLLFDVSGTMTDIAERTGKNTADVETLKTQHITKHP